MDGNGNKVFITGATGFVGSNLTRRYLENGADVYINVRKTSNTWRINDILNDVSIIPVDLTEYEKLKENIEKIQPDIIFHTATYGGSVEQKNLETIIETNINGTINLVRSCRNVNYSIFVNTGSSSEYGTKNSAMKESGCLEPVTEYGASKASATLLCQTLSKTENYPIVTLRLFSPYGRFEQKTRLVPSVILAAINGRNPRVASRTFVRDFIFIDDVLDAYEAVTHLDKCSGKVYNIGSGEQHFVGDVVDSVIRFLGGKVGCDLGVPQAWKSEPACWQADIGLASKELNWKPKISLEQGLSATIDWFRSHRELYEITEEP